MIQSSNQSCIACYDHATLMEHGPLVQRPSDVGTGRYWAGHFPAKAWGTHLVVSINKGSPKWMVYNGKSHLTLICAYLSQTD